jgi:hypothetical protein
MAFDFFLKNQRESGDDSENSFAADDLDMIQSPKDGALVPVAQRDGVHVCWQCFEQFVEDPAHPLRPVEFDPGGHNTRILIHSKCVRKAARAVERQATGGSGGNLFWDGVGRHQARRFLTRATKPFRKRDAG